MAVFGDSLYGGDTYGFPPTPTPPPAGSTVVRVVIPAAINWVWNPSFETNLDGYVDNGLILSRATTVAFAGDYSARMQVDSVASIPYFRLDEGHYWEVDAGDEVNLALRLYTLEAPRTFYLLVDWFEDDGATQVGSTETSDPWTIATSGETAYDWTELRFTGLVAPTDAALVRLTLRWKDTIEPQVGDKVFVDAIEMRRNLALDVYFDGDQSGCEWNGTAHASTSTREEDAGVRKPNSDANGAFVHFVFSRCDRNNHRKQDLTPYLIDGTVEMDVDRDTPMSFRFRTRDTTKLDPYQDYVAIHQRVEYADDRGPVNRQLGLFTVNVPNADVDWEKSEGDYEGADLTSLLATSAFTTRHNIAAGTNYVAAIRTIIEGVGIDRSSRELLSALSSRLKAFDGDSTPAEIVAVALAIDAKLASGQSISPQEITAWADDLRAFEGDDTPAEIVQIAFELDDIINTGFIRNSIQSTSKTLSKKKTFPIGTTRLEAVNKLLDAIAFYPIWALPDGTLTSNHVRKRGAVEPIDVYREWDFLEPIKLRPTPDTIANVVIVIRDSGSQGIVTGKAINSDPNSSTSTVTLSREIVRIERNADIETSTEARDLAADLLEEGGTYYRSLEIAVSPNPRVNVHQTCDIRFVNEIDVNLSGRYWIRRWQIGLQPSTAILRLEVGKLVDLDDE